MPSYAQARARKDPGTSLGTTLNKASQDKPLPSPVTPAVTGILYPSPTEGNSELDPGIHRALRNLSVVDSRSHSHSYPDPSSGGQEFSVDESDAFVEQTSLDQLWGAIRQEKERKMAKERPKVKSLEEALSNEQSIPMPPEQEIPVMESSPPRPALRKQKSIASFRESTDGRSIVATFDMPRGISKQDIHISFQRNRLVVTWDTVEISEWEEDGCIMRERLERKFNRTLPLPDGTKFEEINSALTGRRLVLRYPNMRCIRVETRSRSGES